MKYKKGDLVKVKFKVWWDKTKYKSLSNDSKLCYEKIGRVVEYSINDRNYKLRLKFNHCRRPLWFEDHEIEKNIYIFEVNFKQLKNEI